MTAESSEDGLKLLYLDWCSTQVARRFLELSLDEVWLRSHVATPVAPSPSTAPLEIESSRAVDRIPDYLEVVRRTALLLAEELDLPPFPEWRDRYLANPGEFDDEMFGR